MPIPSSEKYSKILDNAKAKRYALPAINVSSMVTANAALAAFKEAKSDGIVQLSLGAGKFVSGSAVGNAVKGAISLAQHVHLMADELDVNIALHTDHCQAHELDFVRALLDESERRINKGMGPLFQGHMFDGSALPLKENIDIAVPLLERCKKLGIVLEVETGAVGGEEEGAAGTDDHSKLYTSSEDMLYVAEKLFPIGSRFMLAATFGNVHGIYKPGNVHLRPEILRDGQAAVCEKYGNERSFDLVFHGGSGTPAEQVQETLDYGVVKMNIDTATQYAFSYPIADFVGKNLERLTSPDGDGNKKYYDPRAYLKLAEQGMKAEVLKVCKLLRSEGNSLGR